MSTEAGKRTGKPLAVVAASGGLDSCVTAAVGNLDYELAFLHINYGHRTERKELESFHEIADFFGVSLRLVADVDHLRKIGGSSLTDRQLSVEEFTEGNNGVPGTYVPFRNANILSVAVSWAEVTGASAILSGIMEEDSAGYPDCREEFIEAFNKAIDVGTKSETNLRVITPLIHMSKGEVVQKGVELGAPLHLTWSCYQNEDEACGVCESCRIRLKGFAEAGVEDLITYTDLVEVQVK